MPPRLRGDGSFMTSLRKGDIVQLQIDQMAYGGKGVARLNGFVIFVRGAVPGDSIRGRVIKKKKDYAEAGITELLEPSPDRVPPPCPYSGTCGGCQWQHVRYGRQLEYKRAQIQESIARLGAIPDVPVHAVIPSEKQYAYRNKMEFSFSDRPWLLPEEMEKGEAKKPFSLGLHVAGTYRKVIDIEACLLQHETGNGILREVRNYVRSSGVPVYGLKSHQGFWRFLALRYSHHFHEWMVNLVTSQERRDVVEPLTDILCNRFRSIKTVVNNITNRKAGVAAGDQEIILSGGGTIRDRIGPYHFQISANSFFQTNSAGAEELYRKVVEYAELRGSEVVLDLYSGTGTIPIYLSNQTKRVIGMEIEKSAVLDATRNAIANGAHNCEFIWGDVKEKLSAIKEKPAVLIIDPPRAGMHKDVLRGVLELATKRVVYISCNPATMARDLGTMSGDYQVVEIQPVDMFPHTYHIEAIAKLSRRNGS